MSTPPFIPTGPLPSFQDFLRKEDASEELGVAHAARGLVSAARLNELPDAATAKDAGSSVSAEESPSRRDAETNARDAYGPQSTAATFPLTPDATLPAAS